LQNSGKPILGFPLSLFLKDVVNLQLSDK